MKTKLILTIILTFFVISNSKAITIEFEGSGGAIIDGEDVTLCPTESDNVCAEVDVSLWEAIEYWWNDWFTLGPIDPPPKDPNDDLPIPGTLRVYDNNHSLLNTFNVNVIWVEPNIIYNDIRENFSWHPDGIQLEILGQNP